MTPRVLFILINDFPHIGGAERVVLNLYRYIVSEPRYKNIVLRAVTSEPGVFDMFIKKITGVHADYIDLRRLKSNWLKPMAHRDMGESIRRVIQKHRGTPDEPVILLCNSLWAAVVVNGVIRKLRVPAICAVHADIAPKRPFKRAVFDMAGRFMIQNISGWITVSETLSCQLKAMGVPDERVRVIPNGVHLPESTRIVGDGEWRTRLNIPADAVVVTTAGRLAPDKGQHVVIDVVKQLVSEGLNLYLLVTGTEDTTDLNGSYTCILKKMIWADGLNQRIFLTGFVDDIQTVYGETDIIVSASGQESFGLSVLEAMAFGRPVVAFDIGGHKQLVTHEKTGYLVKFGDVSGFTDALRRLTVNADLRNTMGIAGRDAARFYDADATMEKWMQCILEAVQERFPEYIPEESDSKRENCH